MKFFAVVLLFAAVAFADEEPIPILRSEVLSKGEGEYTVAVETGNGIALSQAGHLREFVAEDGERMKVVIMEGSFSYLGDDGKTYTVSYVADENGFRPTGEHFPVAPIDPHHH